MQPPGDYLLNPEIKPPTLWTVALFGSMVVGSVGIIIYFAGGAREEGAVRRVMEGCGRKSDVLDVELGPRATRPEQVEELGRAIEYLRKNCGKKADASVKRLEKLKKKWEAALPKDGPISELKWAPKPQKMRQMKAQTMLPRKMMRA